MSGEASQPLRLILFDVDGTLVDSQGSIVTAMTDAFTAMDLPVPPRASREGENGVAPRDSVLWCDADRVSRGGARWRSATGEPVAATGGEAGE